MVKEKRILSYFMGWLLVGFLVCFLGITNVFAATYNMNYEYLQKYYDNNGSTVTAVTTNWNESLQSYVSNNITTIANSYGAGLSITSPIPLIANHTYTLSVYFDGISNIAKSSKNNVAISTSLTGAASNYANNNFYVDMIQTSVSNNSIIQFVFTTKGGGNYIFFPWTTTSNSSHSYVLTQISMEDLGSEGVSQNDINISLNNQTNTLNQSIQNSTNTITGKIDDMEQSIIESNKATADAIIKSNQTCNYNILRNKNWENYNNNKTILITKEYIEIKNNITYNFKTNNEYFYVIYQYDENKNSLDGILLNTNNATIIFNNTNIKYIRVSLRKNDWGNISINDIDDINPFMGSEDICINKIDETNDKLDNVNNTSKGIWETIKNLPNMFLDMLLGLFIPKDLSFINEFKDVISNKLGFIASVPIQIIDFALGLADVAFNEITTISFPSVEIFGVHFWNAEEIDITILLEKLKPFKYFTDFTCVILCCRTLYDMYHNFTGGGAD